MVIAFGTASFTEVVVKRTDPFDVLFKNVLTEYPIPRLKLMRPIGKFAGMIHRVFCPGESERYVHSNEVK